ncbi:hypothetical protein ACQKWADRAFT_52354 [Trichoderma austrokoningii]
MPHSQKLPTTGTNKLSSARRETSSVTTETIGKTASGNRPSLTSGRTIVQETISSIRQTITRSAVSRNSTTSVTTKHPVRFDPTRSTALPAPTKKHTSTIRPTAVQSASIPRSMMTKTTSRPIETGSKGDVATYVATQDPKYTANRKTQTTTDGHGDNIVIFTEGWRWVPFGLPIGLPPLRLPPPPRFNPDPHPADNDGKSEDRRPSRTKSPTSSPRCTTTEPPECTKTVSFITSGARFESTIFGTCSPVSGCVSRKQSTTTTIIATTLPVIWINEPLDSDIYPPPDDIDHDTEQYFNDLFEKQGI